MTPSKCLKSQYRTLYVLYFSYIHTIMVQVKVLLIITKNRTLISLIVKQNKNYLKTKQELSEHNPLYCYNSYSDNAEGNKVNNGWVAYTAWIQWKKTDFPGGTVQDSWRHATQDSVQVKAASSLILEFSI